MIHAGTYNAPNWVDLSTPDVEAALEFYRGLFGFEIEESESPMGAYFIGKAGGHEVAGIMSQGPDQAGMPVMWTVFFFVEDIDESVALAKDAGGTILAAPFSIPGDAKVAVVTDPTGAMMGFISGPRPEGTWLSQDPGRVCWVELLTRNTAAAEAFYAAVFGWTASTDEHSGTAYTTFSLDGEGVAGMMAMPEMVPPEAPAHWSVYFTVTDCTVAAQRAAELGGKVLMAPTRIEMGSFAVLEDPQGAVFDIMDFADPEGLKEAELEVMELET